MAATEQQITEHDVFDAMERFGGGFVSALAVAWRKADRTNSAKLHAAFGDYFAQYRSVVEQRRPKQARNGAAVVGKVGA